MIRPPVEIARERGLNLITLESPDKLPRRTKVSSTTVAVEPSASVRKQTLEWIAACPLPATIRGARVAQAVAMTNDTGLSRVLDAHGFMGEEAQAIAGWFAQRPADATLFLGGTFLDPRNLKGVPADYA